MPWLKDQLHNYQVIIVHGLWLYHSHAVNKAIQSSKGAKGVRVYVMPHGMLDPYFQKASGRKLKAIRNWLYWKVIESKVISAATGLLFTCEEEKNLARKTFNPYSPKKELVIGLGVEEPPLYTNAMKNAFLKKCPETDKQPFLLFLSRIHPKKGVDLLIAAYISLFKQYEGKITGHLLPKLVIAGPGIETAFGQKIQQLIRENPFLQNLIYFPGMLSGDAKWGAFYGCEAFILPSHQENFGIAVAEALACSKPVLISDQVNIWREIDALGGGIIANDTQEGVLNLLHKWMSLQESGKVTMGVHARKVYESNFSVNFTAQKLANIIKV
jgi:glycosyltransferase involved in cell wall biosynthesis